MRIEAAGGRDLLGFGCVLTNSSDVMAVFWGSPGCE